MAKQTVQNVNKCPICRKNPGEPSTQFGLIACHKCRTQENKLSERTVEIIPERIKEQYKSHKDQTEQPFRDGQLNKRYVELYGTKHIEVTDEEVKNAKYVYDRELPGDYYKK